jgi:hypothetical protein
VALKFLIDGKQVTGFFRPEGAEDWRQAGSCDLPKEGRPKIAIQCYQGSDDKEHWARIRDFQIAEATRAGK